VTQRTSSWWESGVPLETRPSSPLPDRIDVLVVGAGFTGRWLAHFLAKLSPRPSVLVLERDVFTYGASSRNAGFLTCGQLSEMLADTEYAGGDAVVENFLRRRRGISIVRREFPDLPIEAVGSFDWDPVSEPKLELGRALNEAAGTEVYEVRHGSFASDRRDAVFNREDAGLDPVHLLRRLRGTATFAFGAEVRSIGGGTAVVATGGETLELRYGHAFLAINAFAPSLHPESPVRPGRGQVIVTSPVASETERTLGYLNEGYDYFRWLGDRLLIGGGRHLHPEENGPTDLGTTASVRRYLAEAARGIIGHTEFEITHHWAGIMGFHEGRHLGGSPREQLDDATEVVAGFGGMGVALAPAVAEDVAAEFGAS